MKDISSVRAIELDMHLDRYNQHENQVYLQLKGMLKKMNICMSDSEQILSLIDNLA